MSIPPNYSIIFHSFNLKETNGTALLSISLAVSTQVLQIEIWPTGDLHDTIFSCCHAHGVGTRKRASDVHVDSCGERQSSYAALNCV